jgi:ribonuclease P protein component
LLPAANRVRSGEEFRRTFKRGTASGSPFVVLHYLADESHAVRVGFVVSKAVGNAVVRNRTKRRLREIMHARLDSLPAGLYVLRVKPAAAGAAFTQLDATVDGLLARARRKNRRD